MAKLCSKCGETKDEALFPLDYRYQGRLAAACKSCAAARQAAYKAASPERYAATLARRDKQKASAAHKRWRDRNIERERERSRAWSASNPALGAANAAQRRAAQRRATPAWADRSAIALFYRRARQLTAFIGRRYVVDHVVPLVSLIVCGLHVEHNLRVITEHENARKGNRYGCD